LWFQSLNKKKKTMCWQVFNRLQSLYQGSKSVHKYFKKMEITIIKDNVFEDREATMAWFLNGLNRYITNVAELQHYLKIEDMVCMATKWKNNWKKKVMQD
jgi:hypothetical protein